ncbi:MAG: hypothetical protein ACREO3_11370 [Arenimonas sp.]
MLRACMCLLLVAGLVSPALGQTPVLTDAAIPDETGVQSARAKSCVVFLNEVAQHTRNGGKPGTTPSFALVWGSLLLRDHKSNKALGKMTLGSLMFDNTILSCKRVRSRTLGATMDAEFAAL